LPQEAELLTPKINFSKIVPILELSGADAFTRDHFTAAMSADSLSEDVIALGTCVVGAQIAAAAFRAGQARVSQ
jgi:hypothetical protein